MFHFRSHFRRTAFAGLCLFAAALPASAARILLEVNISNPDEVTLTATGEHSLINDSTSGMADGITLKGFFATDFDTSDMTVSGVYNRANADPLMPAGAGTNYTNFGNGFTGVGLRDINLYQQSFSWSGGPIQRFETNKPAFTGEDYLGFEDFWNAGFAPPQFTDGFIGDIHVGYGNVGSGRVIGQFQIVGGTPIPEPAAALGGMTLLGTIILRRRRASA